MVKGACSTSSDALCGKWAQSARQLLNTRSSQDDQAPCSESARDAQADQHPAKSLARPSKMNPTARNEVCKRLIHRFPRSADKAAQAPPGSVMGTCTPLSVAVPKRSADQVALRNTTRNIREDKIRKRLRSCDVTLSQSLEHMLARVGFASNSTVIPAIEVQKRHWGNSGRSR